MTIHDFINLKKQVNLSGDLELFAYSEAILHGLRPITHVMCNSNLVVFIPRSADNQPITVDVAIKIIKPKFKDLRQFDCMGFEVERIDIDNNIAKIQLGKFRAS